MSKLLSIKEASDIFGLSQSELRRGFLTQKYPGMRLGDINGRGKIVFDEELLAQRIKELMK